jgi:CRISPR-associated endoribonuclease Cas6
MRFAIEFKPASNTTLNNPDTNRQIIKNLEDIQQWIYKCLELTDHQLARWLHNEGIRNDDRITKPLVFSLPVQKGDKIGLKISTPDPRISFALMKAFINKEPPLTLNGASYIVDTVKPVEFKNTIKFIAISPILLKGSDGKFVHSYEFTDLKKVLNAVNSNLIRKYEAIYRTAYSGKGIKYIEFELNDYSRRPISYKGYTFHGVMCPFVIIGDEALIKVAYEVGLGAKNACGFGCIESIHLK